MNSNTNYETLYAVGLLDDLHNYFPALLYDSSSFASVRDVLGYIQRQTRARFDLFSYGQREYLSTHPPSPPSVASHRVVRTSFASMPAPRTPNNSTLPSQTSPVIPIDEFQNSSSFLTSTITQMLARPTGSVVPQIQVNLQEDNEEDEEEEMDVPNLQIANALLNLLNLPTTALTIPRNNLQIFGRNPMDAFLQPVVVHPTPEQIAENTTLGNLVSDTDHSCAICQDTLTSEQEGRKLNACGHWFHKNCIDTWLARDVHCPVCRHDIREPLQSQSEAEPSREELEGDLH